MIGIIFGSYLFFTVSPALLVIYRYNEIKYLIA